MDWKLLPTWNLSLGGRYEKDSLGGGRTSPRAILSFNPTTASNLRVGYYTSARSPQFLEARIDLVSGPSRVIPNPELKCERTDSLEVGYRQAVAGWIFERGSFNGRIGVQVGVTW